MSTPQISTWILLLSTLLPAMMNWFNFRLQRVFVIFLAVCMAIAPWFYAPTALALVQIRLFDLSYQVCPEELGEGAVTPGGTSMPASCYIITGKAENPTNKDIYNADIFGRIYDANDNPVMQNRTRLGSIDEVPPGVSDFELRISVSENQPTPLKLEQFKAAGFAGTVRR
nr:hypothetical protein [Thermoleptolyngbya oregonensis]